MHATNPNLRFDAQLRVQVPRDTPGTLEDGVAEVLERVEVVERVEAVDLQGLEPRLNDLTVHARVEGRVELSRDVDIAAEALATGGAEAEAIQRLEDGFGVAAVAELHLLRTAEDPRSHAMEYG